MNRIATVLAALITMGTAANATTLASGAIFHGPPQTPTGGICTLFNAGPPGGTGPGSQVSVNVQIISQFLGILTPSFNDCNGAPFKNGAICSVHVNFGNNDNTAAHACKAVISPDGGLVRGFFTIQSGTTDLETTELR